MTLQSFQTKRELDNLIADFKRFNTVFRFVSLGAYIVFLVYSIVVKTDLLFRILNSFLLVITAGYTAFAAVCTVREAKGINTTKADKTAAKIYKYAKLSAMVLSALLSIFSILTAVEHTTALSILLAILLPVCLALQIIFDLFIAWATKRINRFQAAIAQDMEVFKRDMGKIALGLVKDMVFKRNKEESRKDSSALLQAKGEKAYEEEGIIVVGSDLPVSIKEMKRVNTNEKKKDNVFVRAFKKVFKRKKQSSAFDTEGVSLEEK